MFADKYGRKMMIAFGCVLFTIGAIIQALSWTVAQMSVGRFVIGIGVGGASMVVPVYIAEVAPAHKRGRLIVIDAACITGGQVIAYAIGAAFEHATHGWRYMVRRHETPR
jgi:SP family myo-inositol transporter-like MFS transporter 13